MELHQFSAGPELVKIEWLRLIPSVGLDEPIIIGLLAIVWYQR